MNIPRESMLPKKEPSVLNWVRQYVLMGWSVFPLHSVVDGACTCGNPQCSDAGKHPRTRRGLKDATRDLITIESWFGPGSPPTNIGLVTGEKSGITVIDIDIGEGKKGAESWAEITKDHGEPETLISETGGGGLHVIFKYNSALKTAANVLGKGIDCRNDRGYIVAPPSVHRSGANYKWANWGTALADLPSHLTVKRENRGRPPGSGKQQKYTLEQVQDMLSLVPADDRDLWRHIGIILGREFNRADEAWKIYNEWSDKWEQRKGRNHEEIMREAFYDLSQENADKQLSIGTIVKIALQHGWAPKKGDVPSSSFIYYAPGNNYIYRPTGSYWVAAAVDSAVSPINDSAKLIPASEWLKINKLASSMTSDPSCDEDYVKGYDCKDGELIAGEGAAYYNSYRKPTIELGDSKLAQPFIKHVQLVFNKDGDADQFLDYMAHRVQKPWEKPRFALLIAGGQGVGKDTAVEMCCPAIGVWNVSNIDPAALESGFNEYAAATLVRINEAANLQDMTKWAFNERIKTLIGGSPDICTINPKYGQKFSVKMYCGVIITTNHLATGIYIPADDRRYDVIDAASMEEMGIVDDVAKKEYFSELWDWFLEGGDSHIAAYLNERDVSGFSAGNGQRKTKAHAAVVANGVNADSWLADILFDLGNPELVRIDVIVLKSGEPGAKGDAIEKKARSALNRLAYVYYPNPFSKDGRWMVKGRWKEIFALSGTPMRDVLPDYIDDQENAGGF